ncbi:MAG: hypothetical protein OEV91_09710 [Desulfobulbaceae bacterium]|nr:hypothetical protein [Desulfobulbaceae bacterium]
MDKPGPGRAVVLSLILCDFLGRLFLAFAKEFDLYTRRHPGGQGFGEIFSAWAKV